MGIEQVTSGAAAEARKAANNDSITSLLAQINLAKLPRLDDLYTLYNYQPPTETAQQVPIEQLSLQWDWIEDAESNARREARALLPKGRSDAYVTVPLDGAQLILEKYPSSEKYYQATDTTGLRKPVVSVTLETENTERIAEFRADLNPKKNEWDLSHRLVEEKYRGQEVGSCMLGFLEGVIQDAANASNTPQECVIGARQLDVILFAMRNGYRPKTEEDTANLKAILTGSEKDAFLVTTALGHESLGAKRRPGYIFKREVIAEKLKDQRGGDTIANDDKKIIDRALIALNEGGDVDPEALELIFYKDPGEYQGNAVTVTFHKTFKPQAQGL